MKTITHHSSIEASSLILELSSESLTQLDIFFSNVDLSKKQQCELMKIIETIYKEGHYSGFNEACIDEKLNP